MCNNRLTTYGCQHTIRTGLPCPRRNCLPEPGDGKKVSWAHPCPDCEMARFLPGKRALLPHQMLAMEFEVDVGGEGGMDVGVDEDEDEETEEEEEDIWGSVEMLEVVKVEVIPGVQVEVNGRLEDERMERAGVVKVERDVSTEVVESLDEVDDERGKGEMVVDVDESSEEEEVLMEVQADIVAGLVEEILDEMAAEELGEEMEY